ncbi:aminoglycoside phosphotransferase [Phycicoccus flavus]|uniref:Aminoglycoside phosphotransferase n=1 Tax=Phycicoccus flavus TaxID=2502783 RepID=A0A8T6R5P9_9MICO|nr:aminoglycoside phosphotransferase [Phycicoccus flavus]NHA68155.1 aminoglycoside phosphotransferase [Phycicoccus flavus]
MSAAPGPTVLAAFGLTGTPAHLPGGQGRAWRAGGAVLGPADPVVQRWLATEVAAVPQRGFRLPEVLRAADGRWVVEGWGAQAWVPGHPASGAGADWAAVLAAGRSFHVAVAPLPRPQFLDGPTDPWSRADRAAWGEDDVPVPDPVRDLVDRLRVVPGPGGPTRLVHRDLTGNVLLADGHPPAVIDVTPAWRPVGFAEGVLVADALVWHDAPADLPRRLGVPMGAVARGLLFRVLTALLVPEHPTSAPALRRSARVADALGV